uniref:Uncharacterized protein n=1 Tax=Trichogramma kaykai TaxID=54128 RepID=A0ABD2WV66_9HYME
MQTIAWKAAPAIIADINVYIYVRVLVCCAAREIARCQQQQQRMHSRRARATARRRIDQNAKRAGEGAKKLEHLFSQGTPTVNAYLIAAFMIRIYIYAVVAITHRIFWIDKKPERCSIFQSFQCSMACALNFKICPPNRTKRIRNLHTNNVCI